MRTASPLLLFLAVSLAACAEPSSEEDAAGSASAYSETATALRATSDPHERRLAAVENVIGFGLKALTLWERNTELNGRDVWLTIEGSDGVRRAWRTRENILKMEAGQFTTGRTRFIGQEHTVVGLSDSGVYAPSTFWMDVAVEHTNGAVGSTVTVDRSDGIRSYQYRVEATTDALSTLIGEIDYVTKVEGAEHMARLFTMKGRDRDHKRFVLVLTDREEHHVFPLAVDAQRERNFGFASQRELVFEAVRTLPNYQEAVERYSITWQDTASPSIRLVR